MQGVIVSQCQTQSLDERAIGKKAFDLILCFDDIISNGYRESVTISQIESYIEMDSTDEKVFQKQQMIKESEMKENAKFQAREIAKKRLETGYKRDKMEAISSTDYETQPAPKVPSQISSPNKTKFTEMLNKSESEKDSKKPSTQVSKNSFQQMLAESEMKVSVAKKAPKKGMVLGKPKGKKAVAIIEEPTAQDGGGDQA